MSLERSIPPVLRPLVRAYVLGYASSTIPRLLSLLLTHLIRKRKNNDKKKPNSLLSSAGSILLKGLDPQRFPTFCAALIGGSTLIEARDNSFPETSRIPRLARLLSSFIAAWFSLELLQSKKSDVFLGTIPYDTPNGVKHKATRYAGRTIDLTLFAVTRAVDVVVGELWSRHRIRRTVAGKWSKFEQAISSLADTAIFASSSALIMWAFIYVPERLPQSYNKWITQAAQVDQRLLVALRHLKAGTIQYGTDCYDEAAFLRNMCKDYGWPLHYADPIKSVPFPCEMVHMGRGGQSCELHALIRFVQTSILCLSTYVPLNIALVIRNPTRQSLIYAMKSSARSSAFIGAFTALYYYGVCLGRTRLGPRILGTSHPARQTLDSGICIGTGCAICGWTILLEHEGRRKDIGLWVAPRALATILPRRYALEEQWKETLAFAISTAVVFMCVGEQPKRVRGVFGKLLNQVLYQ
ncbi:hypothetical protein OIDMADRAFT_102648 [Oidiodendron maius Zn]|uniref:Integral membrane protein n=1 Tax=Oidiodendron maius (strain Zn) TaxID=913774 RepID=A0A0C3HH86_OIDMZ|nr:hypothetical protein OIDMADRAFT_102648 [Oidiodendron maius Zn]